MRCMLAILAALLCAACAEDSALPEPTGKGVVRSINAVKASPAVAFRIEERTLESVDYKNGSPGVRYDDFEYNFNFDATLEGDLAVTRIASVSQKIDANRDYTFVLTGELETPDVLVWEKDERLFDDTETVLELRFAHLAATLGTVDVYMQEPGSDPVAGAAKGTLSYGEALEPMDVEGGDYVITLTASGDPSTILYQTTQVPFPVRNSYVAAVFDGDELDTAPYNLRLVNLAGGGANLPDADYPPSIRFMHAASDLATSDIYDDEALTNQVLADHAFGDISGDLPASPGTADYYYTPAGNTGAVLFEDSVGLNSGSHTEFVMHNGSDGLGALKFIPDRRSVSTYAKILLVHVASNHDQLDYYLIRDDLPIEDVGLSGRIAFPATSGTLSVVPGSIELYVTVATEKTVVAGPLDLDLAAGDVVEILIQDNVDPAIADFVIVPEP